MYECSCLFFMQKFTSVFLVEGGLKGLDKDHSLFTVP